MPQQLTAFTFVVRDYDEAILYFTGNLGFELIEDTPLGGGKRWVRVRPADSAGPDLLLARASSPEQESRIGNQAGGRVLLFLETDDLNRDYETWGTRGVQFTETPREEPYGRVVVFEDLYGNRWDLIERRGARLPHGPPAKQAPHTP